jgi:hypothetical protein
MALGTIEKKDYVSILGSDASLRQVVPEGTEGSVVREYETSKGEKGTKIEKVYQFIEGMITNIAFHESDFGKLLQIDIDGLTLSVSTDQAYGEDIMKKLPNIDLSKSVKFIPYCMTTEKGKTKKGVTIMQGEVKIENYFFDKETKTNLHDFPAIPEATLKANDKDLWKIHFITVRKFLEKFIQDKFVKTAPEISQAEKDFNDIPFN